MTRAIAFLRRFGGDRRGVSATIVALMATIFIGMTGMVIDFGRAYWVQQTLQSATDAAALAGGYNIPVNTAIATAAAYSSQTGDKNVNANIPVTGANFSATLKCLADQVANLGTCVGTELAGGANVIQVTEKSVVPAYFIKIAGINSLTVSATSTASARGGNGQALNVMIVLDTTASMSSSKDPNCGLGNNATRESCALAGVRALLQGLNPTLDYVGLMVFPGLVSSNDASLEQTCNKSLPSSDIQTYSNSPAYTIVGLNGSNDFKTSSTATTLNSGSNIVLAANGGGCSSGVAAPGGVETYYAQAINQAQAQLNAFASPHTQNVIVFLSDGDANSGQVETDVNGYISGTTLTVTSCPNGCAASTTTRQQGPLSAGQSITGSGVTTGTVISKQLTGTTGGVGTYQLNNSMTVGSKNNPSSLTAANMITLNGQQFVQNTNECHQAMAAAQAAAAAGTWVYSIAYGSSTSSSSTCSTDSPHISSCSTMQNIAASPTAIPDASKFYSDGNNGTDCPGANTIENLVALFQNISTNLTEPRLIPNNTT